MSSRPCVLVFAGADPSGGAGIQADMQAILAQGAHPLTVITALTVQDNNRVHAVHPVSSDLLVAQSHALIDAIDVAAVKIGIVGSAANASAIARCIAALRATRPELPVVLDPVLASGRGDALAVGDAIAALDRLIELSTLITPNLPEAEALCKGETDFSRQVEILRASGCGQVLVKGGHGSEEASVINRWSDGKQIREWRWLRLDGDFHGSGCTLASAIAGRLALGEPMETALDRAQTYAQQALTEAYLVAPGQRIPARSIRYKDYE